MKENKRKRKKKKENERKSKLWSRPRMFGSLGARVLCKMLIIT